MRPSYGWPITLAVVMIVLVVALIVGWVILIVREIEQSALFWVLLVVGTSFLVLVLVGVVLYLLISIKGIRLNQRQSNFIDSVSHELKSPIASLKLYLQTLSRRSVTEEQQANFYRFMLDDVERLDTLINHMLDAARLDQQPVETDIVDVELSSRAGAVAPRRSACATTCRSRPCGCNVDAGHRAGPADRHRNGVSQPDRQRDQVRRRRAGRRSRFAVCRRRQRS